MRVSVCVHSVAGSIPPLAGRIVKWVPSVFLQERRSPDTVWCCGCCVPQFEPESHWACPGNGWWSLSSLGHPLCTSAGSPPAIQAWVLALKPALQDGYKSSTVLFVLCTTTDLYNLLLLQLAAMQEARWRNCITVQEEASMMLNL